MIRGLEKLFRNEAFYSKSNQRKRVLTKRKPDLRDRTHLPLSYVIFEVVPPEKVIRYLANGLRRR